MTFKLEAPAFKTAHAEAAKRGKLIEATFVDVYNAERFAGASEEDAAIAALLAVDILPLAKEGVT